METEEEAREAATDGQEVQMEAADHLQTQPDSKLSTIKEIKGEAQITDSTEGMLKIPEDQVLVEAPSEIKTPSEHNLNGMASSLNGYVDKEGKISNKHPHEIEAIEDDNDTKTREITDQSNEVFAEEAAKGKVMLENESTADIQPMQELESEETKKTDLVDMSETIHQKDDAVSQKKNQEDSPTTCELHVMESSEVNSVEASSAQATPYQSNVAQCKEQATEENITESEPQILETEPVQELKDVEATEPECIFQQTIVTTSKESVPEENATAEEPAYDNKEIKNDEPALIKEHDDVKPDEISNQRSGAIVEETVQETNLAASEPTNVQAKELESEHISNTVDVEPQGASPSYNVSTSEEFNTQETIKKDEPSSGNQAEQSLVVIKDTEDEKNNAAIAEEEAQDEDVVQPETTADTLLAHEPELEETNNIESFEEEDNIAVCDLPEEAIATEAIPHDSTATDITELTEDVESNVSLAEGAAPEEHILETEAAVDVSSVQEPEIDEIKNTDTAEQEQNSSTPEDIDPQETETEDKPSSDYQAEESTVVIKETEDEKNSAAIGEDEAQEEHVVPTETTADTLLAHEPDLEEKNNIESVEAEDNIAVRDLPEEAIGTEAIPHESTAAGIMELSEDVENNVATAEGAAPEEHILDTEAAVDVPSVQEPEIEEIKNTDTAEQEQNSSTPEEINPQETVTEDKPSSDYQAEESTVVPTEAAADTFLPHEQELEEKNNIESVEAEDNIAARDLPGEAKGNEAIPHESTAAGITELSEDVESNVALPEGAAPKEHRLETETAVDVSSVQEPEIEEIKHTDTAEKEQNSNITEKINPEETLTEDEPSSDNQAEESSVVIKATEDEKNSAAISEEEEQEEHVVPTDATADTFQAHEPELEEKNNIESVEAEDNIAARDLPGEAKGTEAIVHERTTEGVTELSEDVESNVAVAEGAASEELILETEAAVVVSTVQEPEREEIKDTNTAEQEQNSSTLDEINPQETVAQDEPSSDTEADESSIVIEDTEDEKNSGSFGEEKAQDELVVPTETTTDTLVAHEPEVEEKNYIESVVGEDDIAAHDIPKEALEIEAIPHESTATGITELGEDVESNVDIAEGAAPEEHILETEAAMDVLSVQEPEIEEMKNTDLAEKEKNSSTPEEISPQETVTKDEKSSNNQAEESSVVIKDTEHDLPEEAIGTEAQPHESTTAGITELSEDVENNVVLAEGAAPEHLILETEAAIDVSSMQETEIEEIKNTDTAEQEQNSSTPEEINPQETVTQDRPSSDTQAEESSVVIKDTEDEKNSAAIAEEEAQEEHVVPTEAVADTLLAHEPEHEEKNNIESVEAEDNIEVSDLREEIIGTEAIPHESTAAGITELGEDVESNVALVEGAAPEELILETEADVDVSSVQETEIEEIKNTDTVEQEQNSSTPEEINPQETVTRDEPSSDTQAEESSVVIKDTEDEKNNAAIAEEEAQDEDVVPTETTADTLLVHEPELEETNNIESVEGEDNIAGRDLPQEAITTEAIPHDSTAAGITELSEDVESNVALTEGAAPEEHILETEAVVDVSSMQEPEIEEIKNTDIAEQEQNSSTLEEINPQETVMQDEPSCDNQAEESSVVIKDNEDEKNSAGIAEEEAQIEHVVPTEAAADTFLAHEPELEEKNNIESVEAEYNKEVCDLPEEATGTEAKPHDSTAEGIMKLSEAVESNVALAEGAAPEDTEAGADVSSVQEPEIEEIMNTDMAEQEQNSSTPEEINLQETVTQDEPSYDNQAEESSVVIKDTEDEKNSDSIAEEEAQVEHVAVVPTEAAADTFLDHESEQEEKNNIESVEAEGNIAARDIPEEAIGSEAIPHESTAAGITELSEDVESNVALAEGAAPQEHILETEATIDVSSVQEPEIEEIKNTNTAEQEQNSSIPGEINPQETVTQDEPSSDTQAEESSVVIKDTEDEKNSAGIAEEEARDEHVVPTEAAADTFLAHEPELEEKNNIESVEAEDNIAARDLPEEVIGSEAIPHESTAAGITELSEDAESNFALAEGAAPQELILETETAVDVSSVQEPEIEEIKNTDTDEQEQNSSTPEEINPQETETQDEPSSDAQAEESSVVIKDTEDEKNSAGIAEEEAQDECVLQTETTADTFLAHEPELEEKNNIESVEAEDNIAARDLPEEAIGTEAIPHESTAAGITELSEDAESNFALAEGAAPQELILETETAVDVSSVQEPEIEEIKNTDTAEQEQNSSTPEEINPQETVTQDEPSSDAQAEESSVVIKDTEDEKNSAGIGEEEAQDECVLPTETTGDTFLAHEPKVEEKNNIESVEAEDNIAARDLPEEATGTEAIPHESTTAGITELVEDVESYVSLAEGAAPEEHILETEIVVDVSSVQEPELEEVKNTGTAENEHNGSTPEEITSMETLTKYKSSSDTQAEESSIVIKDTEDEKNSVAIAVEEAGDEHVVPTEATADTLLADESELGEKNNIESIEAEENIGACDLPEEAIGAEAIPHESTTAGITELSEDVESNVALLEGAAPEEHILETGAAVDVSSVQEPELEKIKSTDTAEEEHNGSTPKEINPQETVTKEKQSSDTQAEESSVVIKETEDVKNRAAIAEEAAVKAVLPTEAITDTLLAHEPELEDIKNIESVEPEDNIGASDLSGEEMDIKAIEVEAVPHERTTAGIKGHSEDVNGSVALDEEISPEEHILETEVAVDISSVREPKLEEIKNTDPSEQEHKITESGLPEEVMNNEAIETEVIPNDRNVASIKELTEDDIVAASAPDADTQQVPEQESVKDVKCTDTTEHPGETPPSTFSTFDELTPTGEKTLVTETTCDTQQVQSLTDQETKDSQSQYVKTEEFSELSTFSTPEEAALDSDVLKCEPASEVQQAQELDSAEETRGTEDAETDDCQQNGVSTLEETTLENNVAEVEPNVDDQHVQEVKSVVDVIENEARETEEISKQINFITSENVAQESSEAGSDRAFCVQPEKQIKVIELTKDSEDNQLVEAEETSSQSNIITLEDPTGEDRVGNEIEPSVGTNQEHELELVEEIKDTDAPEAEEASHTGQAVSLEEQFSESNELTHNIQQVNELDATEEMKGTEDISGEENCNQQTVHENIKDEIQESAELKDETSELGDKIQRSENRTEEDDVLISTEDTIETSNNINPIKEEPKDVVLQTQVCERSVETIKKQDEAVKNISLDQQKEDEGIEPQKEELQTDEQKHDDKQSDFIIDTQVETIDVFEAEQTDAVVTELLKNEVNQHISKDSIPIIADVMVENITEINEQSGDENGPNNEGPLEAAAQSYNDGVQGSAEKDAVVAKTSSSEHDETTGEIRNEQVEPCLPSSMERDLQAYSDLSNDQMLEN
ncbi:hypothetical protein GUJ93_ZPchr0002g26709, partial [Zizania palustris]